MPVDLPLAELPENTNQTPSPAPVRASERPFRDKTIGELLDELALAPAKMWQASNFVFVLYALAIICGIVGNTLLLGPDGIGSSRSKENALYVGAPYLWLAAGIWLLAELIDHRKSIKNWWQRKERQQKYRWLTRLLPGLLWLRALLLFFDSMSAPLDLAQRIAQDALGWFGLGIVVWLLSEAAHWYRQKDASKSLSALAGIFPLRLKWPNLASLSTVPQSLAAAWQEIGPARLACVFLAALSSGIIWLNTTNNSVSLAIILLWFINAALWGLVFAPLRWSLLARSRAKIDAFNAIRWREYWWAVPAFALIMLFGAGFRLAYLDTIPPELYDDPFWNIRDAWYHSQGHFTLFRQGFGREPVNIYLSALLAKMPGFGFNFYTIKMISALEGLLSLPIFLWLGIEWMVKEKSKFGLVAGLMLAGFIAVSYWHAIISRNGLRIVLAPLFLALIAIFLARALRYNRRADFVKAGLALGFAVYTYQAMRIVPIAVVIGVIMAMVLRPISWRERLKYMLNLAVLAFVAFMVFLPLFHYMVEYPESFWSRSTWLVQGNSPDIADRVADSGIAILLNNIRKVLLMFNWAGDNLFFYGLPGAPVMDVYTGTFFVLGLIAWSARMLKSRDPVLWLAPWLILLMLSLSVMTIAYDIEVPNNIRTIGALPFVYLVAALPVALIVFRFMRSLPKFLGTALAILLCGSVLLLANQHNTRLYFDDFYEEYLAFTWPTSEIGEAVRSFAGSDGAYGNAFIVNSRGWLDIRFSSLEAGMFYWEWPNAVWDISGLPQQIYDARGNAQYPLDANRDFLFFYDPNNAEVTQRLREWFPSGRALEAQTYYHPGDSYMMYRVPALGEAGLQDFLDANL